MKQYSKRMVIIHWLILALLVAAWFLGTSASNARQEDHATLTGYAIHALVGGTILLLTLARLFFRAKDGVPPPMGDTPMDKVAKGIQHVLYGLLLLLPVSGMMVALTSGIGKALLAGDATLLPNKFVGVPAHDVHEVLGYLLIALVVVHVLGAVKHQFIMKDGLMERMSLRRKN